MRFTKNPSRMNHKDFQLSINKWQSEIDRQAQDHLSR